MNQIIDLQTAIHRSTQYQEQANRREQAALKEFKESQCDLFSFRDWQYYSEETGLSIGQLREMARYSDPEGIYGTMLKNALIDGDTDLLESFYL